MVFHHLIQIDAENVVELVTGSHYILSYLQTQSLKKTSRDLSNTGMKNILHEDIVIHLRER